MFLNDWYGQALGFVALTMSSPPADDADESDDGPPPLPPCVTQSSPMMQVLCRSSHSYQPSSAAKHRVVALNIIDRHNIL